MWREAPQDVFFAADLAYVEPIGIHILDLAERSGAHQRPQPDHGWMVLQDVTHHEDAAARGGEPHQFFTLLHLYGQRLLDEYVFTGFEGRPRHLVVFYGG